MDLSNLRTNQLSESAWASYADYLAALDRYDVDAFASFLADDVTVQFNNDPPLVGKPAVVAGLGGFWSSVQAMGYALLHEPLNVYGTDEHYALEALNHYDSDGRERITVRAVAFTDRNAARRVTSIRIYQDLAALYADPAG